jgi:hypothetical protein
MEERRHRSAIIILFMRYAFFLCMLLLFGMTPVARAQLLDTRTIPSGVTLSASTNVPEPRSTVEVRAYSSTLELSNYVLVWRTNGTEVARGIGKIAIDVEVGPAGSETTVGVEVEGAEEDTSAAIALRPASVDILWDSDSYTPPFYRGRALPSAGSTLALHAMTELKRSDGTSIEPADIIYTWRSNGTVLTALSGRGKSSIRIPSPSLFGSKTVSVSAESADGLRMASGSITIGAREPSLRLYVNHPLFGILFHDALRGNATFADSEVTLTAVPFYAPSPRANDPGLQYAWRVNGSSVDTDPADPAQVILSAERGTHDVTIDLSLTHLTNWYLDSSASWNVRLGTAGDIAIPFNGGPQ